MSRKSGQFLFLGTFAQTALLVSAALLVAQSLGFFLLVNERDRWRLLDAVQPAVERFVSVAGDIERETPARRFESALRLSHPDEHFLVSTGSAIENFHLTRESDLEERLSAALKKSGLHVRTVQASSAGFANSPRQNHRHPPFRMEFPPGMAPPPGSKMPSQIPRFGPLHNHPDLRRGDGHQEIEFSAQLADGSWLNAQFFSMRPSAFFLSRLLLAEIILFAIVLTVTLVLAMRLARPMMRLATAADNLTPDQSPPPVPESGPADIRAATRSFNAMTRRIGDLLREKDRMLGAIGHDLRTPLASLRLRAEAVESPTEREKMIETIDDMTRMVDEILDLARMGHSGEKFVAVDLGALADSVVEEYIELGKNAAYIDSARTIVRIQPLLVRRLLRNLIENGLKFGERVRVTVEKDGKSASLLVMDDGPGIPPDMMGVVLEPFSRLESSRSRETGGAGLGLSIAAGIARSQGAVLVLENRSGGGLNARVVWPNAPKD
ncbi:MAG TPA: ATP-binding protein [Rhizomicrobium sp.]|nr:ATP-binding protein [Rhizomicrobium sp.]